MRLILSLFIFYLWSSCRADESKETALPRNGYAFYYPLTMTAQHPTTVCLAIDQHLLPATVKVTFANETCEKSTCVPHSVTLDFSCWEIVAPATNTSYYESQKIDIEIETKDKDVKFKEQNDVQLYKNENQLLMETDRRVYKMGDTVKIRFIAFDFDLKPVKDFKISNLRLRSPYPSSATVKEWENITTTSGLAHLEFKLAPDTPEGYWSISGDGIYSGFEVKKYVLPRFQALVTGPDNIYNGTQTVTYTVCGKYSYGRNVKGVALLAAKTNYGYTPEPNTFSKVKDLTAGCAKFEIHPQDLGLEERVVWSVQLTASVTEAGTEQVETTSKYTYIHSNPYSYKWDYNNRYIKAKLPYTGDFELTDVKVPLDDAVIQICYKFDSDANSKVCNNFSLNASHKLKFTIPPLTNISDKSNIQVEATIPEIPLTYAPVQSLNVWHSNSSDGIKIVNTEQDPADCESSVTYTVIYNSGRFKDNEEVEFKYILTSRWEIISTGTVLEKPKKEALNLDEYPNVIGKEDYDQESNPVDKFTLKLKLDKKIYTTSKLLVYYDHDGEVISDTIDVNVNKCAPNQVEAKWTEETLYPGEVGTLNIKTGQDSLCSVSSIDKASTFLGSAQEIGLDNVLSRHHRYFYSYNLNCIKSENQASTTTAEPFMRYRYYSSSYDSYDAFKDTNVGVMSNLKFISKTCNEMSYPVYPLAHHGLSTFGGSQPRPQTTQAVAVAAEKFESDSASGAGGAVDNRGSAVRSFFPETWLWDLVPVPDGDTTLERKLPDSITDWQGSVLCMSSTKGFGTSDKIEIRGFKPFFVDILLPYSIKRNKEILHLPIPVFNYLNHSLPIRVTLEPSDDVVLVDGADKNSFSMCLAAEDSYTHNYRIKATKIGYVNITVSANVDPAYAENCAPESVIRRRDVVQKSLLVEPEGYPSSLLKSALLCANDTSGVDNIEWSINLPENVVPDTVDGKVTINSDLLGPMFQNLENILVVPTGCGEQTMATLTPNLYVLKYLEANNALTDKVKEKILKNLEIGYQRMLNYVHNDGSFSAFGQSDPNGSMFLTAFVIRTFRQMKQYVFIDDDVINKAVRWMISHQLENGCFDPVHHVFHEMGLASSKNQTTALTSYVLISFLETDTKIDDKILSNAKECIINDKTNDKYTLAITSYALGLLNLPDAVKERLDKLTELSDNKDSLTWWTQSEKSQSANVEVSSYVLMSLLKQDPVANLGVGSSIVRWLQSQMNPRGGFFSTVDTVVGLDAISRYAMLINKKEPNVKIALETKTDKKELEITKRDRTKTEVLPLTVYPNEVKAKIEGDGCVAIQAAVSYYLDKPLAIDDLQLDIELKPVNQRLKCSLIELKPCVAYTALGQINMAIVEVNMPSGYAPDQASLYELKSAPNSPVKKFEQIRNQVVFYLTQLSAEKVCLPFKIDENLIVENVANATVKLYDYYKPELSISKSFKLEDCEANISVPA